MTDLPVFEGGADVLPPGGVLAAAAELAGILAELSVTEVEVGGRLLRAGDRVDLPGLIALEAGRAGRAAVRATGLEVEFATASLRWRTRRADLAERLRRLGWSGSTDLHKDVGS